MGCSFGDEAPSHSPSNRFTQSGTCDVTHVDFEQDIEVRLRKNIGWSIVLGAMFTCSYLYSEDLFATNFDHILFQMNIYALLFWIKKLLPISDLIVTNTVLSTFGLALIPLFWIGRTVL